MDPSMDDPMSEEEEDEDMDLPPGESRSSVGGSGSGGGGGKGVVVKGVEIAEEDVYAYGDPDDPLDRVLDVYLADELEDHLYLLQYPMQPADRPSSTPLAVKHMGGCSLTAAKSNETHFSAALKKRVLYLSEADVAPPPPPLTSQVKAANHLLEVEHPIKQGGKHYDKNAPGQLRRATQKHTGSRVRPATNFAFGVIRSDELHLTPIHATMQMRPCFQHIDEAKAQEIEMDLDDPDNGGTKEAEKPQQVSFKKKESERATAARKSSYAYKKSIEDAEPWVALEVHGQNDDRSLDEFSRMFVDDDASANRGTITKEFPPCERYLQGLDYMEEYDENGESFSAGGRGRSLVDSIDLVTAGTGTYSPVNLPAAPVQQLGGDAKVVAYLKLAHLVPFSMLLDVTNMSPDAVLQALSVEGRQKGLLMRGNWAALPADVWPRGPPHAADCLSVAQCLLHRYGAVSRPDLQRRFPELEPVTLKELLSHIAELDTVDRRWVPKVKDGLTFGMEYPEIVELEEERWTLHESILKERLGEDILAPPSCPTFGTFVKVLEDAARAASAASASAARAPMSRAMPSFGVLRRGEVAAKQEITEEEEEKEEETVAPARGAEPKEEKPNVIEEADAAAAAKGKAKAGPAAAGAAAVAGAAARGPAPKRHFKPKKRPAKAASAVKETAVKQEHEGDDAAGGGAAAGGSGDSCVEESKGTAAVEEGRIDGGSEGRRGTARSRSDAGAAAAVDGGVTKPSAGGSKSREGEGGATAGAGTLPAAKEEPREQSSGGGLPAEGKGKGPAASGSGDTDMAEGATAAEAAAGGDTNAAAAAAAEEEAEWRTENKAAGGKSRGRGGGGSKREEPATRPKVKPRSNRSKSKGK
ncbi:unnamed protein product [Ectocarpus sp. CCAP 1310/34]|nr:unnamed protein product [Ectocarpus sp. CCAP 1310/34]